MTKLPPRCKVVREYDIIPSERVKITCSDDVAMVLANLALEEVEVMVVLCLDTRSRVIERYDLTRGLVDASLVHPREVFRTAIAAGASSIIVAHNHPSGDPTPSAEDKAITKQLVAAGQLLDIPVYDHLIIGNATNYFSFAGKGLLS